MIQIANHIDIERPVSKVFEFVADVENNPQWMPVRSVQKLARGPVGKGTKFKQKIAVMGKEYELNCVITTFEPDKKISFVYQSSIFTWRGDCLFEPTETGTRVSAKGNVSLAGIFKLMETNFAPKIRKLINDTSPRLKQILES